LKTMWLRQSLDATRSRLISQSAVAQMRRGATGRNSLLYSTTMGLLSIVTLTLTAAFRTGANGWRPFNILIYIVIGRQPTLK
jgi:hypothetical protein